MITSDLVFYGETSKKMKELKDESGIFERNIDIYLAAGVIGAIYNQKKDISNLNNDKTNDIKTTINVSQILGTEAIRIKFLTSLIFIIESHNRDLEENELLRLSFADWFSTLQNDNISSDKDKYKIFNQYVAGGVDILYERIIGSSNDPEKYARNFYKFISEINILQINSERDRIFLKADL